MGCLDKLDMRDDAGIYHYVRAGDELPGIYWVAHRYIMGNKWESVCEQRFQLLQQGFWC